MDQPHSPPRRPVVLAGTIDAKAHLEPIGEALRQRGHVVRLECSQYQAPVRVPEAALRDASCVVIVDGVECNAGGVITTARRLGVPVVLQIDGLAEFANAFFNERAGPGVLAPAPVDMVLAAGTHNAEVLKALGNRTAGVGLPRLGGDRATPWSPPHGTTRILCATANTPAHTPMGYFRVIESLESLRDEAERRGVEVVWRIAPALAELLGVELGTGDLGTALASVHATITLASTLAIESMLAGVPTALLHPHPWPLWVPAAWRWLPGDGPGFNQDAERCDELPKIARDASVCSDTHTGSRSDAVKPFETANAGALLDALLSPTDELRGEQERLLDMLQPGQPAVRAAEVIEQVAGWGPDRPAPQTTPVAQGKQGLRVVSVIDAHASTVGGVQVWSERMGDAFGADKGLGIDWVTLRVADGVAAGTVEGTGPIRRLGLDPTGSVHEQLRSIERAFESLQADVVLPNYGQRAAAAAGLWRRGDASRRVLAIAHTDDGATKRLWTAFDVWDGAVGVSASCSRWLTDIARGRPIDTLVYGVPAHEPRESPRSGPLRLAYIGRVAQRQKRILDLIPFLERLNERRLDFEFHLIGDGETMREWTDALTRSNAEPRRVRIHGPRSVEWVQSMLPGLDVFVNCSEAEGTSIAMLEAMAASLVPCVTDTPSGSAELLRDGENAIIAPIGEPHALADALCDTALDRGSLAALGAAARRTVIEHGLTIDACARAYADTIQRVASGDRAHLPPRDVAGLVTERLWTARGPLSVEDAESMLRAAGFDAVAEPSTDTSTLVISPSDEHAGRPRLESIRNAGGAAIALPTGDDDGATHLTRAFFDAWQQRGGEGRPLFIGVGPTRVLPALEWLASTHRAAIAAFLQHGASPGQTLFGVPVVDYASLEAGSTVVAPVLDAHAEGLLGAAQAMAIGGRVVTHPHDGEALAAARGVLEAIADRSPHADVLTTLRAGVVPNARSVRAGDPGLSRADLVVLGATDDDFDLAQRLRRSGADDRIRSAGLPGPLLNGPARLERVVESLGGARFGLYGAGQHTDRLLRHAALGARPACILDDSDSREDRIRGVTVVDAADPVVSELDAVVLSSYRWEDALWDRAAGLRERGVAVHRLYR